jgi:hypothetical protein
MPEREPDVVFLIIKRKEDRSPLFYRKGVLPGQSGGNVYFINEKEIDDVVVAGQIGTHRIPGGTTKIKAPKDMKHYVFTVRDADKKPDKELREYTIAVWPNNGDREVHFVVHKRASPVGLAVNIAKGFDRNKRNLVVRLVNETMNEVSIVYDNSTPIRIPGKGDDPNNFKDIAFPKPPEISFSIHEFQEEPGTVTIQQCGGTEQAEIIIINT